MTELTDFCIIAKSGHNWTVQAKTPDNAIDVAKEKYKIINEYELVRVLKRTNFQNRDWNENPEHYQEYKIEGDYIKLCDGTEKKPYDSLL